MIGRNGRDGKGVYSCRQAQPQAELRMQDPHEARVIEDVILLHGWHGAIRFDTAGQYDGILEGLPIRMRPVHPEQHSSWLGYAMWYCRWCGRPDGLEAVQCYWPDANGRFPADGDCDPEVRALQPALQDAPEESAS